MSKAHPKLSGGISQLGSSGFVASFLQQRSRRDGGWIGKYRTLVPIKSYEIDDDDYYYYDSCYLLLLLLFVVTIFYPNASLFEWVNFHGCTSHCVTAPDNCCGSKPPTRCDAKQRSWRSWKWLPGWWFGAFFIFPYIGLLIIPIDVLPPWRAGKPQSWWFPARKMGLLHWVSLVGFPSTVV